MNTTPSKCGGMLFAAIVCLSLSVGPVIAQEETTELEKTLPKIVQSDKETVAEKKVAEKKVEPKKTALELPKIVSQPTSKPVDGAKKSVGGGWTVVAPNPGESKPVETAAVTEAKKPAPTGIKAPEVSPWNAMPKVVESGTTDSAANDTDRDDETKAPLGWGTVTVEVAMETSTTVDAKPKDGASAWDAILKNTAEASKDETPKEEAPKKEAPKKEEAKKEEAKKEEAKKEEPKVEEPKTEKEPVEEPKKEEKTETEKPKPASDGNSSNDMTDVLDALEKETKVEKVEKAEKPAPKKEAEKPTPKQEPQTAKKLEEKKPASADAKKETETAKKEPAKLPEAKPAAQPEGKPEGKKAEPPKAIVREFPKQIFPDFDADLDDTKYQLVDARRVGDPHAPDKIKLMYDEIINGLKTRNVTGRYEMWKNYARTTLRNSAGLRTGSELDGRCRLEWYKKLFSDPIRSVFEVEEFSRAVHHGLSGSHRHILETMGMIREKMDVPARNDDGVRFIECKTPIDAVNEIKRCLLEAQMAHAKAISTLTSAELADLEKGIVSTFCNGCTNGHTIPNRTYGRRLIDTMEKIDKSAMYTAAEALLPLTNPSLHALLDRLPEDAFPITMVNGQRVQRLSTSAGDIVISGRESQSFDLDSADMRDVVCVISLGGNDHFREGTCGLHRPVLAIINLHGNDTYTGSRPGIQGGSILGVSILVDAEGDDKYSAGDVAQGSTIGGSGMLFDFAGHDEYKAVRRAQGHALCGVGLLIDRKGNDKYRAALWAQGFGAPGGFGTLNDVEGHDHYYCGGMWADSYPEHPGYDGWGQGVGAGIRQGGNGGIGMILDGGGNDNYEVDYFGHGGGYWVGVGVARDFGGNDVRHGTTRSAYNGGPRQHAEWTRFANGFGCHYALGYLFDDEGEDVYGGRIMGTGMAWDLSIGYLCDFNGSDKFTATGGMTQGVGAEGSIGILFSYGGDDVFMGRNQGYASSGVSYHSPSNCGGNISFLINYGGNDKYGSGVKNNSYVMRGSQTGFLIDRPTDREAAGDLERLKEQIAKREKEIEEYDEMVKKGREEAAAKGRRYAPRQRRPAPISADQTQRLGSVPHFDATTRTGANEVDVK